jgi:ACS family allantoate permease-like MFS transporter
LTNFASIITRDVIGATTYRAVMISSAGGAVIVVLCLTGGFIAMKVRNMRGAIFIFGCSVAMVAAALLWKLPLSNKSGLVAGVQLLNFTSVAYAMALGFTASNTAGYSKVREALVISCRSHLSAASGGFSDDR